MVFLVSCTGPAVPKRRAELPEPNAWIEVHLPKNDPTLSSSPHAPATAERRGAELFRQDLVAARTLNGLTLGIRFPEPKPKTKPTPGIAAAPPSPRPSPRPKEKKPAGPQQVAGRYGNAAPDERKSGGGSHRPLPSVTCARRGPERTTVTLSHLTDGALQYALQTLRAWGHRSVAFVVESSERDSPNRKATEALSERLGIRIRFITTTPTHLAELQVLFTSRRAFPMLAWVGPTTAGTLLETSRKAGYAGPIILGPRAVHPELMDAGEEGSLFPPQAPSTQQAEKTVYAVGHKLAVADRLDEGDPLRIPLQRFWRIHTAEYKTPPTLLSACAYDALLLLSDALIRSMAPSSLENVATLALDRLRAGGTFEGTLGTYQLTPGAEDAELQATLGPNAFFFFQSNPGGWEPLRDRILPRRTSSRASTPTRALSPLRRGRPDPPPDGTVPPPPSLFR